MANKKSGRTLQLDFQAPLLDKQKAPAKTNAANKSRMKPKRKGPFFEDDEDEMVTKPPKDTSRWSREPSKRPPSQPLSELSQEQQNSNRHGSQPSQRSQVRDKDAGSQSLPQNENFDTSSAAVHLVDAAKTAAAHTSQTTAPGGDTSQQKEYLNNAIAHLLAAKEAAARRFVSETSARNDSSDQFGRRRRGPLGRAPSCGSFGSMRADSVGSNISQDERREQAPLPDPSQKIIYEDEKAQEERRALIRKMGGHVDAHEEVKRRAESIGVVKDAVSAIGVAGGRGKRRDGGSRTR